MSVTFRRFWFKMKRHAPFYIQFIIVLFIIVFLYDKMVLERKNFRRRRSVVVQQDLLDYNDVDSTLRQGWQFKITKHYDINDLRTYTSKPKIIPKYDLPGERGETKSISLKLDQF